MKKLMRLVLRERFVMSSAVRWLGWLAMLALRLIFWPGTALGYLRRRRVCPPVADNLLLVPGKHLALLIRTGQVSSQEVVGAYISRVKEVNPLINAVVQDRFQEAMVEARNVDELLASGRFSLEDLEATKPWLGVPLTVKETIAVKGMSNNGAFSIVPEHIAQEDADIIRLMREAGAIPILVSNTPELCLNWETFNPRVGTTNNPYDSRRTAAGSSGGEGALLGAGASVISVGSDIGGSLRLPAVFSCVYGHKPTPGFVSNQGHRPTSKDENWDHFFTLGPMCRYATDLPLLLRTLVSDQERARELRLDQEVDLSRVRVFYMETDGTEGCGLTEPVSGEVRAALRTAASLLHTKYGATVKEVSVKGLADSMVLAAFIMLRMNGIPSVYQKSEETPDEWNSVLLTMLKRLFCLSSSSLNALMYAPIKYLADCMSEQDYQRLLKKKERLMNEFEELLGEDGVFLYPAYPSAAYLHGQCRFKLFSPAYMVLFNALEMPATACPVGLNRQGLPIGIQISAWQKQDRLTFAVAQALEKEFGGWISPSPNLV